MELFKRLRYSYLKSAHKLQFYSLFYLLFIVFSVFFEIFGTCCVIPSTVLKYLKNIGLN